MGPFFQSGVEDEVFADMNEVAPEEPQAILVPDADVQNIENSIPVTTLTDEEIGQMKVVELRQELEKRECQRMD